MGAGGSKGMETQERSDFMVNSVQNIVASNNGVACVSVTMNSSKQTPDTITDKTGPWDTGQDDQEEKDGFSDLKVSKKSTRKMESASQNDVDKLGQEGGTFSTRKLSLKLNRVLSASDIMSKFKRSNERSASTNRKKSVKDGPLKVEHSRSSSAPVIDNPDNDKHATDIHKSGSMIAVNSSKVKATARVSAPSMIGGGNQGSQQSLDYGTRGRNRRQKSVGSKDSKENSERGKKSRRSASTHRLQGGTQINVDFLESLKTQRSSSAERGHRRKGTVKPPQMELLNAKKDQGNSKSRKKSQIKPSDSETENKSNVDTSSLEGRLHHRRSSSSSSLDMFLASSAKSKGEAATSLSSSVDFQSLNSLTDKLSESIRSLASHTGNVSLSEEKEDVSGSQVSTPTATIHNNNNPVRRAEVQQAEEESPGNSGAGDDDFLVTFAQLDLYFDSLVEFEVQRIPDYEQYLCSLLAETDPTHPDYEDLNKAVSKVRNMVKERQEEITLAENEHKMESVQHRFPNDDLQLQESKTLKRSLQNRRRSAPGGLLLKSIKVKHNSSSSGLDVSRTPPLMPDQTMTSRTSLTHSPNRTYILEGPVQLLAGLQSMERYLFLFNDLLLVAKQKSSTTFKLKERVRVCELWTASCLEDVCELSKGMEERAFVVGWPTCNFVASFDDAETKNTWLAKLNENIQAEKEKELPKTVVIKILNKEMENLPSDKMADNKAPVLVNSNFEVSKSVNVGNHEEAEELVKRCMEQFHITKGDAKDYQLWVRSGKEAALYPLIGHEQPYSIKMGQVRDAAKADGSETPVLVDRDLNDNNANNLQLLLRETKKSPAKLSIEESQRKKAKVKKSPISNFFRRRQRDPSPSACPAGKLFGHPLSHICEEDNELPKPIHEMLGYLFETGPFTAGILRKPANQKCVKDLREKLDNGEEVRWVEVSPIIVSSTLKEFLRSLPDCLLLSELYPMWISTVSLDNLNEHIRDVQHVCLRLPSRHNALLRHLMCVLYHISKRSEENGMNAYNLAVCISQSLLWNSQIHDSTTDLAQQSEAMEKVPKLVHFLIEHCIEVFGEETIQLFGEPPVGTTSATKQRDSSTDSDSMNSLLSGNSYPPNGNERRDNSSVDSLDPYSEYSPGVKTHLSPTNLSRDSGLFSSDTGLNEDYSSELDSVNHRHPRTVSVLRTMSHETAMAQNSAAALLQPISHHSSGSSGTVDLNFDPALDIAMDQSSDVAQSYPPKTQSNRKMMKRKGEPVCSTEASRMPTVHSGVELRTDTQMAVENTTVQTKDIVRTKQVAPRAMPKRSNDSALGSSLGSSLGSVEESSEQSYDEFQERHSKEIGLLRKSESGGKLYYGDNLIHTGAMPACPSVKTVTANQLVSGKQDGETPVAFHGSIKRKTTDKSNTCSNSPPSTRHSWGGILDSQKQQGSSADTAKPHSEQTRLHSKSVEKLRNSSGSVKKQGKFSLSPADSLEEETEDEYLRLNSDVNNTTVVVPNTSVSKTLPPDTSVPPTLSGISTSVQSAPIPKESKSPPKQRINRNPRLRDIKSQSLDSSSRSVYVQYPVTQNRHSTNSVLDAEQISAKLSPRDGNSEILKGMTPRGSDLFPNKVKSSSLKVVVASEESSVLPNTHANKASVHHSSSPRSKSAPRTAELDYQDHIPRSAQLVKQVRNDTAAMERSSSDTRVSQQFMLATQTGSNRPEHPPSYQEAMKRKALYKQNIPEDQKLQQKQASARARKLYAESQKKYTEEQKQKDYAYFSEPEAVIDSRETTEVTKTTKAPPSYEVACKRSEHLKEQRRKEHVSQPHYMEPRKEKHHTQDSRESTPVMKGDFSSRDSTPVQSIEDREKTPTPQDVNITTSTGSEKKKRNKSRERREGQRLSDTRLENNRKKKKGPGVHRSKSDSSEHIHKQAQLRSKIQDNADSTDSDEEWTVAYRPRRVTKSVDRTASKERLNGAVDIPLHKSSRTMKERPKSVDAGAILRRLQETGMDAIGNEMGGSSVHSRHNLRNSTTVKNKDWHKELAEQYGFNTAKTVHQSEKSQRPQMHFRYNRSMSVDDEELGVDDTSVERQKKRWAPPIHPSKDLVVLNNTKAHPAPGNYGKDYNLNRSSSHVTASKKPKSYSQRELRSNIKTADSHTASKDSINNKSEDSSQVSHTHVSSSSSNSSNAEQQNGDSCHKTGASSYSQHHPKVTSRNNPSISGVLHDTYRNSDSAASTNSEREDSDMEDRKGLSWSVSKLRNIYDVNASQLSQTIPKASSAPSKTNSNKTVTSGNQVSREMTGGQPSASSRTGEVIYLSRSAKGSRYPHEAVNPNAEKQYV